MNKPKARTAPDTGGIPFGIATLLWIDNYHNNLREYLEGEATAEEMKSLDAALARVERRITGPKLTECA